jgi:hypothetical protein
MFAMSGQPKKQRNPRVAILSPKFKISVPKAIRDETKLETGSAVRVRSKWQFADPDTGPNHRGSARDSAGR